MIIFKPKNLFVEKFYLSFSLLIFLLSSFLFISELNYFFQNSSKIDGFAVSEDSSQINITIQEAIIINFTLDQINWGSGRVTAGYALLNTGAGVNNVTGGDWPGNDNGFLLENIGNLDVKLYLKTGLNASSFIGGNDPIYQYNITNNETSACVNTSDFSLGMLYDVNDSFFGDGTLVCDIFRHNDSMDELRIDVKLKIPSDSKIGSLSDIMTATAYYWDL